MATYAAADRALAARSRLGALAQVSVDLAADLPDGGVRFVADNPVFVAWGDPPAAGPAASTPAVPRVVAVGVGCSQAATAVDGRDAAVDALAVARALGPGRAGEGSPTPAVVATIDRRRGHPAVEAAADAVEAAEPLAGAARRTAVVTFPASLLAAVDVPNPSADVDGAVGTPSVAEAAALLAAGPGARLVVEKRRGATTTAAVAVGTSPASAPVGCGSWAWGRVRPSTGRRPPCERCGRPTR